MYQRNALKTLDSMMKLYDKSGDAMSASRRKQIERTIKYLTRSDSGK